MPSIVLPTFSGSTSNAAVIFSLSPLAVEIFGDGLAQMAHAQHGDVHGRGAVEDAADVLDQHLHVIALLRVAREADQHQVAAHLHGRDAVDAGQYVRKDMRDALPDGWRAACGGTRSIARWFSRESYSSKLPWLCHSMVMVIVAVVVDPRPVAVDVVARGLRSARTDRSSATACSGGLRGRTRCRRTWPGRRSSAVS